MVQHKSQMIISKLQYLLFCCNIRIYVVDYTQHIDTIIFDTLIVYLHSPQPRNEPTIYGPGVYSGVELELVAPSKLIPSKNF